LTDTPALVNEDAMGDGWFIKVKVCFISNSHAANIFGSQITDDSGTSDLMDEAAYAAHCADQE
jgi:glycine cleavage system H lipoate-binding protein